MDTTTASIQTRDLSGVATPEALREDLNQMTLKDLCRLPGIGEVTAQRILDYRQAHGGFRSVEELAKIKGIGEKTLAKLKELVYVED
ncbi:MAG: helix-hairpin-helix domain-containing protein [Oscillospiraceae bacterium]|nr:helix-hairpin-helix domain-containing protein [Oscillospiraceae bacterium]